MRQDDLFPERQAWQERQAAISRLLGIVRRVGYQGNPPRGYDPARDAAILRNWLRQGRTEPEIRDAIEGLRAEAERGAIDWLKPGDSFTLRALVNTRSRDGTRMWDVAEGMSLRVAGPMPENLKDVLRRAIDG